MPDASDDSIGTVLGLSGAAIASLAVTAIGVHTEIAGVQNALAGSLTLGAWEVAVGLAICFVGIYLLGYREFWIRWRTLRATSSGTAD